MPRDVRTRWNSTYKMLEFAITYRSPIDQMTAEREYKMRDLELDDEEWEIAKQLRDVLKVSCTCVYIRSAGALMAVDVGASYAEHRSFTLHVAYSTFAMFHRFSMTRLSSSQETHPALRRSYQQWTTLTRFLQITVSTRHTRHVYEQLCL